MERKLKLSFPEKDIELHLSFLKPEQIELSLYFTPLYAIKFQSFTCYNQFPGTKKKKWLLQNLKTLKYWHHIVK